MIDKRYNAKTISLKLQISTTLTECANYCSLHFSTYEMKLHQTGWSTGNPLDLYSGGAQFESQLQHQLS
jgi:hypothetical protein